MFTRANGQPVHPHVLSQTFERVQVKAGLSRIRLHDLRHTHATLLLKAGVPLKVVSERLGHSSPAFTMAVYDIARVDADPALAELQDAHAEVRRAEITVDAARMRDRLDRLMIEPTARTIDRGLGIEL